MKLKVANLEGPTLDRAVHIMEHGEPDPSDGLIPGSGTLAWQYSTDWRLAGPLIEGHQISVWFQPEKGMWHAEAQRNLAKGSGATPLVAAMRAYVASSFGAEVDLP